MDNINLQLFMNALEAKTKQWGIDTYIGPSVFYDDITRVKNHITTAVEINEAFANGENNSIAMNYMTALVYDYEQYVKDFGYLPVEEFIKGWTIMVHEDMERVVEKQESTVVYTINGKGSTETVDICGDESYYNQEHETYFLCCRPVRKDGVIDITDERTYVEGDLYYIPFAHIDYLTKTPKSVQKGEKLCPILITRTNRQSN